MDQDPVVARQIDAAQSILNTPAAAEARRLEAAVAASCAVLAETQARIEPGSRAGAWTGRAGVAIYAGQGSPMTQGLAMGLSGPVSAADLDAIEAHLRPDGAGPCQIELCPFADPTLPALLAARRYRVNEWQLVWSRPVSADAAPPPDAEPEALRVRRAHPGEVDLYLRAVMAGFLETDVNDVSEAALSMMRPTAYAPGFELYVALWDGEIIGGAGLAVAGGVALMSGSGVRPRFRRRGAQGALLRARLLRAQELGCDLACSSTLPGTSSRRNMERRGFAVAYPKIVLLKDA